MREVTGDFPAGQAADLHWGVLLLGLWVKGFAALLTRPTEVPAGTTVRTADTGTGLCQRSVPYARLGGMAFDTLRTLLARDDSACTPAALNALLSGAEWELPYQTASARLLRDNWSFRQETLREMGRPPRPGLAEAVERLDAAGDVQVYMALITDPPRRYHVYLSEDLTSCVGVWEGRINRGTNQPTSPDTATGDSPTEPVSGPAQHR
ncbi:hypothetical protein LG634_34640 [Streptomyces bambusae]|uniref:hypothetical protein n=1 Tax=Streptomyces bambusae TaxID=1550616 RepID=UPI001CFFC6C7|nr:hypothetical protein [Streptomyces bambusae]MCB5169928.1 hypothetical protein [Streptomyces bambusae]